MQGACVGGCGFSAPAGPLTEFVFKLDTVHVLRGGGLSGVTGLSYRLLPARRRRILGSRAGGSKFDLSLSAVYLSPSLYLSLSRAGGSLVKFSSFLVPDKN